MQNKLYGFLKEYQMVVPGDRVICALSGGADSVALLFALYLLKDKLEIQLEAAHFNHHLRGEESDRDEAFVKTLCDRYDIPLHLGGAQVTAGKKGLEAAARDARYTFLNSLDGRIATAHTADDNAETVLMHLIRGTGLKGLGGIMPVNGNIIRPMLGITRQEVEEFLSEWCLTHIEDSSNGSDAFLRNRIRRNVMPLLKQENSRLAENLSAMALGLRQDAEYLYCQADFEVLPGVEELKNMHPALRSRCIEGFLKKNGVKEPEQVHIHQVEALLFSERPSAKASLPGGVTVSRCYDRMEVLSKEEIPGEVELPCPGEVDFGVYRIRCHPAEAAENSPDTFTVASQGSLTVRTRNAGDAIRLSGGTKSLKKLFIDWKIPAAQRKVLPVVCDDQGILGVYGIGVNLDRAGDPSREAAIRVEIKKI